MWGRTAGLVPAATALCSAACHPFYPTLTGVVAPGGGRWDVYGWVLRNEPSLDPARMQAFRQHERVYVGEADEAVLHRDRSLDDTGAFRRQLHRTAGRHHSTRSSRQFAYAKKSQQSHSEEAEPPFSSAIRCATVGLSLVPAEGLSPCRDCGWRRDE